MSRISVNLCLVSLPLLLLWQHIGANELTFELPDNARECFHEKLSKGAKFMLEFQVVTGGNYDVDLDLQSPSGKILYKEAKKQYDQIEKTAEEDGVYQFCFSNEFSTISHKVIYIGSSTHTRARSSADARLPSRLESRRRSGT